METAGADFWIDERADEGGRVRLGLVGELDIGSASRLEERLRALAKRRAPVILDLGRLQFIDSSGLRELVRAVSDARRDGWSLELDDSLSPQVRQVIDLLELRELFWPSTQGCDHRILYGAHAAGVRAHHGSVGTVAFREGEPFAVGAITLRAGPIAELDILADPERVTGST